MNVFCLHHNQASTKKHRHNKDYNCKNLFFIWDAIMNILLLYCRRVYWHVKYHLCFNRWISMMVWTRVYTIGSNIWTLHSQLAELFGKNWEAWHWWSRCVGMGFQVIKGHAIPCYVSLPGACGWRCKWSSTPAASCNLPGILLWKWWLWTLSLWNHEIKIKHSFFIKHFDYAVLW